MSDTSKSSPFNKLKLSAQQLSNSGLSLESYALSTPNFSENKKLYALLKNTIFHSFFDWFLQHLHSINQNSIKCTFLTRVTSFIR